MAGGGGENGGPGQAPAYAPAYTGQPQQGQMGGGQMMAGMGGTAQTGYMSSGGYGNNMEGGFGGFNGQMDQGSNSFGNFGPSQRQGGYGGGFGGGYGPRQTGYGGSNRAALYAPANGYGNGFNSMQGGYGGQQMQNPFMGGQGGFRGGYDPYQMQNPFMGGQGFGQDRGFRGNQRNGGQFGRNDFRERQGVPQEPAYMRDAEFQGYQQQQTDLSQQMNDYMQKAPMYQQLQDLQGKMQGVQNRYNTSVTPLPSPRRVTPEPVADMDRGPIYPNQQAPKQSYEDYVNGPMPAALGYKRMTREEFGANQMQNEQRQKAGVYGLGMPQGGLQGGLGGLLGLANSGGFGRNMQPNLNNFTAPYGRAPQRQSYDEYFAERSRSPIQTVIPTREQYDNPVYQPTTPQYRG